MAGIRGSSTRLASSTSITAAPTSTTWPPSSRRVSARQPALAAWPSTTWIGTPARNSGGAYTPAACGARIENWKRLPPPGPGRHSIRPPIALTRASQIASPSPTPPWSRVLEPSTWKNASKSRSAFAAGMPGPVSVTEKTRSSPCMWASTVTDPSSVNLMALFTRFTSTCCSRPLSTVTREGSPLSRERMVSPLPWARWPSVRRVASTSARGSTGRFASAIAPASILEKSRMSLSRLQSMAPLSSAVST